MNRRRGSNQHLAKWQWSPEFIRDFWTITALVATVCLVVIKLPSPKIVSPLADPVFAFTEPTPTPTPTPDQSKKSDIIYYIAQKWEKHGTHEVVRAINCFYSESGLRPEAVNDKNSNGTVDRGVAQINSIHGMSKEDAHNAWKNIDKAYEIYKRRGWNAWYGKLCN